MIERVTFYSEESGFSVLRVKAKGRRYLVTVIGKTAAISAGEHIESGGNWINDKTHGLQFKAVWIKTIQPTTLEGIEKYLGSGLIKGIGPVFAKKLVRGFGDQIFDIIETEPKSLLKLEGIGTKRVEKITHAWDEQKAVRSIMVFCSLMVLVRPVQSVSTRLIKIKRLRLSKIIPTDWRLIYEALALKQLIVVV